MVQVDVNGTYYDGYAEDVLIVYDPSLGFTTGGGWFYWPDTEKGIPGKKNYYRGDRTNFEFTMKYDKKGQNVQGSLLLIRYLSDGTIYRIKNNALYGMAIGSLPKMGWASFSGKATYLEPGWSKPMGNYEFIVYVEDRNQPGKGIDRFWIEVRHEGEVVTNSSMSQDDSGQPIPVGIQQGNIVVPHR
jgi:hypothetical protein